MTQIQETHINSFYRELEEAEAAADAAQSRVEQLKQAIRDRGGELPEDEAKAEKKAEKKAAKAAKKASKKAEAPADEVPADDEQDAPSEDAPVDDKAEDVPSK